MDTGSDQRADRGIDVSVVVPAYNRRASLDRCLTSLLVQRVAKEIIVVDGGSRDGTRALLDLYAAHHPRLITVIHDAQPDTPGGARNRGLDRAVGRYVFFCDAGDHLAPDALARLVAAGDRNGADIVVGKVTGVRRGLRESAARASLAAVYDDLSCFKLFRRDFLDRHAIRFDEAQRCGEDMTFTIHAYCHARVISVVADGDCYHAEGGGGAATRDPLGWLSMIRTPIEVMARHVPPGALRDRLLLRHLRRDVLAQLGAPFLAACEADREKIAVEVADICGQWLTPGVRAALDGVDAARVAALDDPDRLVRLARFEAAPLRHRLTGVEWRGDRLLIAGRVALAGLESAGPYGTGPRCPATGDAGSGRTGGAGSGPAGGADFGLAGGAGSGPAGGGSGHSGGGPESDASIAAALSGAALTCPAGAGGAASTGGTRGIGLTGAVSAGTTGTEHAEATGPASIGAEHARTTGTASTGAVNAGTTGTEHAGTIGGTAPISPGRAETDGAELTATVGVVLRDRLSRVERVPPVTVTGAAGSFLAVLDVAELPPGVWDVHVVVECEGARRLARLGSRREPGVGVPAAHMVGGVVAVPFLTRSHGHLGLDVGGHVVRVPAAVRLTRAWWRGRRLRVEGEVGVGDEAAAVAVRHLIWRERTSGRERRERAVATGRWRFAAETAGLRPGVWDAYLELDLGGPPVRFPVKVVDADALDRPLRWWRGPMSWGSVWWGAAQWTARPYATAVNRRLSVSVRVATPLTVVRRLVRALSRQ